MTEPAQTGAAGGKGDEPAGATYRGAVAIIATLARREVSSRLVSLWPYVVASGMALIAAFAAGGFASGFATETVAVSADPLRLVHAGAVVLLAIALGTAAAASLAWEREHRTMEVLFAGPVTPAALITAKLITEVATLALLIAAYGLYLLLARPLGSADPGAAAIAAIGRDAVLALPLVAFGILVASLTSTVRQSVLVYLAALVALATLAGGRLWLDAQDPNDLSLAALALRRGLDIIDQPVSWLSPVGYLVELLKLAVGEAVETPVRPLAALALAAVAVIVAIAVTRRRGPL